MEIIVVCLLILILILFIRGTTIREGARGKRKGKNKKSGSKSGLSGPSEATTSEATTSEATTSEATTSEATTSEATTSGPSEDSGLSEESSPIGATAIASGATASGATAIASANARPENRKQKSNPINKIMKKINSIENSQQKIRQSQQDIKQSQQEIKQTQSSMDSYYRDLSNNMLTQYTTYKNGFASEYDTKMNKINEGVNNAQTYSNSASVSAAEAANSAASAQASLQKAMEIEKNVFGKLSASIIQNNIIDASGSNKTVIDTSNVVIDASNVVFKPVLDVSGLGKLESFTGFNKNSGLLMEGLESIYTKTTDNKTIFDLQNEVASAINDFYASYTDYLKCATIDSGSCNQTELTNKANALETKIEALKAAYSTIGPSDISGSAFIERHNALIEQASRVRDLRSSIDQKYALKTEKEIMRDYNASLYTGIGLTVAAASLTYYIIMEL